MVVIAIVGVLAALLLPMFGTIQLKGNETKTLSNMRQMGIAVLSYANDNSYQLPNRVTPPAGGGASPDKWPRVLYPYVQNLQVYGCPLADIGKKSYRVSNPQLYLDNSTNNTSYIYNGGNDVQAYGQSGSFPRLNSLSLPSEVILLGIPLPQANNFYMDFAEKNNDDVLNKAAFADGTPYMFCDGSLRTLKVVANVPDTAAPPDSGTYTDWLWLFNKDRAGMIQ